MPPDTDTAFATIYDPLRLAFRAIRSRLAERLAGYHSDLNPYWGTVQGFTLASDQTLRASLFLVGDRRLEEKAAGKGPGPFPAQGVVLQRGLLELLASLMAISEERKTRDALFRRDGYRERVRRLRDLRLKYGADPRWKASLDYETAQLEALARLFRLSAEEASDPDKLRSWPSPDGMLKGNDLHGRPWLSGTRLGALRALYFNSYGPDSRVVHQKDVALYYAMMQAMGFDQQTLTEVRNVPVLRAITLYAALLTEVNHELPWRMEDSKPELRLAWDVLVPAFDPAAEVHAIRYRDLLV